jgi:predicted phosphoadenosine phosphosulfate sulfurtransferase
MAKILKKKHLDVDCVTAAKDRLKNLYASYDKVVVDFSGGKDSTAMLYLTIEVAREIGKLPVEVIYIDHEVEGIGTANLVEAVSNMPEVNFIRYALPFSLRNACSFNAPKWFPWHPEEKELWVRPLPADAVTHLEGYIFETDPNFEHMDGLPFRANAVRKYMDFEQVCQLHITNYEKRGVSAISLIGIRAQESLARFTIMSRKKTECYVSTAVPKAYPIYDWNATDVWKYIRETGLPYNTEYDLMNKTATYNQLNKQRVGSIFAEESLRTLDQWQSFYGEYWHKILERAEGVKTAWRYCNDGMYTGTKIEKVDSISWHDYTTLIISKMAPQTQAMATTGINKIITWHKGRTNFPIADAEKDACPLTGISWQFLARIAIRGDSKERNLQKVTSMARTAQDKAKITRDEAVRKYGTDEYKLKYFNK